MLFIFKAVKKYIIQASLFCLLSLSYSVISMGTEEIKSESIDLTEFGKNGFTFVLKKYVYQESDNKGISISLKNNNGVPYLFDASILFNDTKSDIPLVNKKMEKTPFIVLPPLYRLEPSGEHSWSIRRINDGANKSELPNDRESLFWIAFRGIPLKENTKETEQSVSLTITPTFYFKLLYRPESIVNLENKDVVNDVIVEKVNNNIVISNKSPLHMTFEYLKVGEIEVKKNDRPITVKPFSTLSIKAPDNEQGELSWLFNDENFFIIENKEY